MYLAADEAEVDLLQLLLVVARDEDAVERVEEVVARRAGRRPTRRQRFGAAEDLLRHHEETPPEGRGGAFLAQLALQLVAQGRLELVPGQPAPRRQLARALQDARVLEQAEVARRVGEAVWMIDAQSRHLPLLEQPQRDVVRVREDGGILHADGRQRIDVEEASGVDFLGRDAPMRQAD